MRDENTDKKNPIILSRIEQIQKEIDEVRNREREYRKIHANEFGDLVEFDENEAVGDHSGDDLNRSGDEEQQQRDSLEANGVSPEPHSSDGALLSTPFTSNSSTDLSMYQQKPLDVTHRQSSLNSVASIPTSRPFVRSPVSPVGVGVGVFQPQPQPRVFVPNQKGLMQKFIISHGKIGSERGDYNNNKNVGIHHTDFITSAIELSEPTQRAPIERDEYGRPVRKGYVPVKDKIQQELQDLESREAELKVLRKSLPIFNNNNNDEVDYNVQSSANGKRGNANHNGGTVIVQADVKSNCDKLTILQELNEVPSSTKLIEQWENLIKEQQRQKIL